jgi:hypothetical protein
VGDSKHADSLWPLLHRETDAAEVLVALRRRSRGCVSVANTNILAVVPARRDAERHWFRAR